MCRGPVGRYARTGKVSSPSEGDWAMTIRRAEGADRQRVVARPVTEAVDVRSSDPPQNENGMPR